jgi:hypothetical protein
VTDETLTAYRRFGLLLQREAAHQIILEALPAGDSDFLRKYHWEMSIDKVVRIAESAIALGEALDIGPPPKRRR